MSTKLLIVSAIGAATVAAAAAGGYSALRRNAAEPATAQPSVAAEPVDTSEAAVEPAARPALPGRTRESAARAAEPGSVRPVASQPNASAPAPASGNVSRPEPQPVASAAPMPAVSPDPAPPEVKDSKPDVVPPATIEPARPLFEEVTVKEDSVIGIQLDSPISSETARVEDKVTARVARDVSVDGHTAIPAGARLEGNVSVVERGGKFKDRARVGIQFHSLVLADGTRTRIQTETIFREGSNPTGPAAAKVGASAVVGSILGAVIGGKKGAAIGATTGAAAGGAAVATMTNNELVIPAGTSLTVRMTAPVTLSIERDRR